MGLPVFNGLGTPIATTSPTFTVTAPATQTNLDINLVVIVCKPWDMDFILPVGWEKVASHYSGTLPATGAPTSGSVRVSVFRGFGRTGDIQLSGNAPMNTCIAQMMSWTRDGGDGWLIDFAFGTDAAWGPDYAAYANSNYQATPDDTVLAITGLVNASVGSGPYQYYPGQVLNGVLTSGATPATVISTATTFIGAWCGLRIDKNTIVSGTQTGNPQYSFASADLNLGATIFMRMHSSPAEITVDPIDPLSHTAGYQGFVENVDEYDYYFVQRVETSGRYPAELVRGGGWVSVAGRQTIPYYDYEFHFTDKNGLPCVYRNELYLYKSGILQDVLYTPEYTPEFDRQDSRGFDYQRAPMHFLKDVNTPSLNIPVTVKNISGFDRDGRVLGRFDVIGRKNPVVITDVTSGMSGEMEVLVHLSPNWTHGFGTANRDFQVRELIDQGGVYFFQSVLPMFAGIEDFYFTIDSVSFRRLNNSISPFTGLPITAWTIGFTEVDRPAYLDIAVGGGTWAEVNTGYSTWSSADSVNTTFLELYQRLDIGGFSVPSV